MDQTVKTRWVEALRSGNYEQGSLRLRSGDNRFCCLGVLCDIMDPEGWENRTPHEDWPNWSHGGANAYLPTKLRDSIGLESYDESRLSVMNDKWKYDFNQIADQIEEWL